MVDIGGDVSEDGKDRASKGRDTGGGGGGCGE